MSRLTNLAARLEQLSSRYARSVVVALFIGFVLLRLPFLSHFLVNWDAVQFALGTLSFDLHHHQPHPPGYISYVTLGSLLNHITGSPASSLTLLSALGGGLAPAILFLLGRYFMPSRHALLAAVLFGISPLMWYYSEVALTYAVEVAVALPFLWLCYRTRVHHSTRDLVLASLLLALLGSLRQSAEALFLPLWLYTVWPFPWRVRITVAALLGGATLIWLIPLIWLSGGLIAYLEESLALAGLVGGETSVFSMKLLGLGGNLGLVAAGVLVGLNVGFVIVAVARHYGATPLSGLSRHGRVFFLLWAVPALLTFLLVHAGQLGYVLALLPIGYLWVGVALSRVPRLRTRDWLSPSRVLTSLVSLFVVFNIAAFFVLPWAAYAAARAGLGQDSPAAIHLRQYDLEASDAHWRQLMDLISDYDPDTTLVLATIGGPVLSGSYRHVSYYLPEYRVYGVGPDEQGVFGHLFTAWKGDNDYHIDGLGPAQEFLRVPHQVQALIIPDLAIALRVDETIDHSWTTLYDGTPVLIARPAPGTALSFDSEGRLVQRQDLIASN